MEQSINFASDIQREFVSTAGRVDRGVRQAGFWVLAKTSMPAVLVELDFICNPTQERFLNSESGQEKMAKSIYNAFVKYKSDYDRKQNAGKRVEESPSSSVVVSPDKKTQTSDSNVKISEQAKKSGVTYYKVQFMALPRKLPANSKEFKGLSPVEYYKDGGMYKYTYGKSTDRDEIQKQYKKVKSLFRDAFIIKFRDGKRVY